MLERLRGGVFIGVGKHDVAVLRTRGWWGGQWDAPAGAEAHAVENDNSRVAMQTASELTVAQLGMRLDALFDGATAQRGSARVVVADHWVRHWMTVPPKNARRRSDGVVAAAARFQAVYGESLADWQMVADVRADKPFLCCAMPTALLGQLEAAGHKHRVVLLQVVPHFVSAWNRWQVGLLSGKWFGVLHGGQLTFGVLEQGHLREVRSLLVPKSALADGHWLQQQVHAEVMRGGFKPPSGVQLCGEVPEAWLRPNGSPWVCRRLDATDPVAKAGVLGRGQGPAARLAVLGMQGLKGFAA